MYILVKGAGMSEANGIYKIQGQSDGVDRYECEKGFELFRFTIPNSNAPINKRWYIGSPTTKSVFYICKSNDDLPPMYNWKVHPAGQVPAPSVEVVYEEGDQVETESTEETKQIEERECTKQTEDKIESIQQAIENELEGTPTDAEKKGPSSEKPESQATVEDSKFSSSSTSRIDAGTVDSMSLENHTISSGRRSSIDMSDTDKIFNELKEDILTRENEEKNQYTQEKSGLRGIDGQLKIVIPSFEHVEDESNSYILYSIHIYRDYYEDGRMNHEEWNIKRRYGRFKALLQILKIENPRVDLPPLPKTSLLKHMDHEYIQEKRIQLEEFLSKIIDLRNNNKLYVPATIEKDTLCIFLRGNCCFLQGVAKNGDGSLRLSLITNDNRVDYYTDEIRLNLQDYLCPDCGCQLYSTLFSKNYRLCEYTQMYFCNKCHSGKYSIIPMRILHYWDFMSYRVSNVAKEYLDSIYDQPIICPVAVNPFLYDQHKELQHLRLLRLQLNYMHDFIISCKQKKELLTLLTPRLYLMSGTELYSLADLVKIYKGVLNTWLQSIVDKYAIHITQTCETCKNKGFICEVCNKLPPIYAFELDTVIICRRCNSVYHKECYSGIENCPRCIRNKKRRLEEFAETGQFPEEMQEHYGISLTAQNTDIILSDDDDDE